ncbi:MAG: hypothetical protein M3020_00910 [Myxococcota bacterium]|nr:hypothetical protein [Myxococcota bacterium]
MASSLTSFFVSGSARAYRPFDGTDANVGGVGVLTVEAGPLQLRRSGGESSLSPGLVFNLGFAEDFEAIVDARQWLALGSVSSGSRLRELESAATLKWLLREGSLQDEPGVSVAVEAALQAPEVRGEGGFGAKGTAALSYRWDFATLHVNQSAGRSRLGNLLLSNSLIVEGPDPWMVRPVAELTSEQELDEGASYGCLLGAIATASDTIAFDLGLRVARQDERAAFELRLGLTWGFDAFTVRER